MKKRIAGFIMSVCMALCAQAAVSAADIEIGDYVQMGTYYNEPILWRCVDKDENGPLMLSDKIICIKEFDTWRREKTLTGSHSRDTGTGRQYWGSNYWGDSNIRSWLNSSESAGNVNWLCGNPPDADHSWYGNAYDEEAGFLTVFTQDELKAVKEITQKSILAYPEINAGMASAGTEKYNWTSSNINDILSNYNIAYAEYVTDKMFLLDVKQVHAVYNNGDILGEDYYIGEPTAQCVANSEYKEAGNLEVDTKWLYWLRSPWADSSSCVLFVHSSGDIIFSPYSAHVFPVGIRPAFYLNEETDFISGEGAEKNPYLIDDFPEEYFTTEMSADGAAVTNVSGRTQTAAVITVGYTDGALTDIHTQTETFSAGESKRFQYGQGTEHKVLVWDSIAGMKPLTK